MREIQELRAEPRSGTGKGPAFQIRQKGHIPAHRLWRRSCSRDRLGRVRALERHVDTGTFLTTLFMLDVTGKKTRVIPRDVQLDPVSDRPVHVDFMRLAEGAKMRLAIPVRFKGQEDSPGIKRGGVLNIVRHEIELICPADDIPTYRSRSVRPRHPRFAAHLVDLRCPKASSRSLRP